LQQDPNIKVLLKTKVESVSGSIGNFRVSLDSPGERISIDVAGIVLASGIELFDPSGYENYAYFHPNVITSLEYEQLQKPLGSDNGIIKRASDGKVPSKIAWIQCVGSRDINRCDAPYCSSVCCMYALKEAINTKEMNEDIDTVILYMDMRAHGKGFEQYLNKALNLGVRLVRCRIHTIDPDGDDIYIRFVNEEGKPCVERFDLAVLSVGLRPSKEAIELAKRMGLELDNIGFIRSDPFSPGKTNIPGIFVCGGASGPYDIRQSIYQADSVSATISTMIEPEPFEVKAVYPEIRDISNEKPRLVFAYYVCDDMGEEIEGYIEESLKNEPRILKSIKIKDVINRIEQIEDAIRFAVFHAYMDAPVSVMKVPVIRHALVVGGGITGLEAALSIAKQGYPVTLVERSDKLGGNGLYIKETWQGDDVRSYIKDLISAIRANDKINIMTDTMVKKSRGTTGNFVTLVEQNGRKIEVTHGVTIIATGGEASKTSEYMYGKSDKVLLWSELRQRMIGDPSYAKSLNCVVFIQCVGSRDKNHPYCSNICCSFAIHSALEMKKQNPNMDIYIINRDIRTFGINELLYREAREKGIIFIRYDLEKKPVLQEEGGMINVIVFDHILQKDVLIKADLVSLQTAIEASNNKELAAIFGISIDQDGFFVESPEKMKPVDSTREGIFIAGIANYPKDIRESISQAKAVSTRAVSILKMDYTLKGGMVAEVDPEKCAVCCTCVRTCPFEIPYIDHEKGAAVIDPLLCRGCGICVAECPGKAIKMSYCSDQMLTQAPAILLKQTA